MKKLYFLFTVIFLSISFLKANSQENLIYGSDMESADADYWFISSLANDPTSTTEYSFGYTDDSPTSGINGCLHFTAANVGTNGSHIMFYQQVTLERGTTYQFDMDVKAIQPMLNSWFEVYLGSVEPADGADYGPGMIPLGGFKWSGWEAGCADLDLFDGALREIGCMAHSQDDILFPGEGDTTMFIGFKAGIWAVETTIEFVVDNVSLVATGVSSVISTASENLTLFPNPVLNTLKVISEKEFIEASILNITGKEVLRVFDFSNSIDVSTLKSGIYFIELRGRNGQVLVKKFSKQ